jgi:integrase
VALPRTDKPEIVPLTTEEVGSIIDEIEPRFRALVILMAYAGLRPSEAMGITRDRVDWLKRTIRVDRQLGRGGAGLVRPKTDASVRRVPVPDEVLAELSEHVRIHEVDDGGRLFPQTHSTVRRAWVAAIGRAGLPAGTRLHDLRHYYASVLIRAGESVKVVQARLGHASATETLNTYAHLWPADEDRTRDAVSRAIGDSLVTREDRQSRPQAPDLHKQG